VDWDQVKSEHARHREQGKFLCISAIPGYEAAWRKIGPEALLMAIAEDPDWVREMYEYDTQMILGMASPGGFVFHSDHSIPTQVTFDRYAKVVDLVRAHGV